MASSKLGRFLEQSNLRNRDGALGADMVVGLSSAKQIIATKAHLSDVKLTSHRILPSRHFAYVRDTSRRGDKLSLGYNRDLSSYLVSSISVVFKVNESEGLLSDYLYMYFNRPEFDRYARFNSWGSVREAFSWDDMCEMDIEIPPLPVQQKYVDVYNTMLGSQRAYERNLRDLDAVMAASMEGFKHDSPMVAVGALLEKISCRNRDGAIANVQGININKEFMPSVANLTMADLTKYKVIQNPQFAFSAMQTGRDERMRIALFREAEPALISSAYSVLRVKSELALAEYVMLWFSREESDRYGWFVSDSSIRSRLELSRFYEIEIPLPPVEKQRALVSFYNARHLIHKNVLAIGALSKKLCPILIKGSLEETNS
ncbi:MAG: restriction endonuclease subunit S [Clostridiales bacterium]|jgi:type I restriction enzyme S subunit|nr:restriction endonuclease subunit S [Clostridiales bacterium]